MIFGVVLLLDDGFGEGVGLAVWQGAACKD